ncbi:MAG: hypothetical protein Tsb0013_18670 [Phycisphaerales bacterium]
MDPGDGGGGDPDPDPDPDPEPTEPEGAVWVTVPRPPSAITCQLTPDITIDDTNVTRDLYLRLNMPDDVRGVDFGVAAEGGLVFNGPTALQPAGNTMSSQFAIDLFPCIEFDSYFDLGEAENLLFIAQPPSTDWGPVARAAYVVSGGAPNEAVQRPDLFPDSTSYYIRVARVTTPLETEVSGRFEAVLEEFGTGLSLQISVEIPPVGGL